MTITADELRGAIADNERRRCMEWALYLLDYRLRSRKELFDKVGGFDEERYPHCYSDIDFCYRIHEQGFYNVVRNNMYLFYHEASEPVEEVRNKR